MFISCSFWYSQGINYPSTIEVLGIPEGRRIKWWTDLYPHRSEELHTSKGLVNLFGSDKNSHVRILSPEDPKSSEVIIIVAVCICRDKT